MSTSIPTGWRDQFLAFYRRTGWRGFTRLYNFLKPIEKRREIVVSTCYGSRFLLNPYNSVDFHVVAEGFYESEVIEALRPELAQPGIVLWVIGANFGLHAVTAKYLFPTARVIAFEPYPGMAVLLNDNCRLNQVEIELHTYALAGHNGVLSFYANNSGNPGMSTLHPVEGNSYEHRFHVGVATANSVISAGAAPAPNMILMDAEGAEAEIMAGFGSNHLATSLRRIVFEAPNDFLETKQPAILYDLIVGAGFSIEPLIRREKTAHTLSNFLARRK